jgi:hypothetical protein
MPRAATGTSVAQFAFLVVRSLKEAIMANRYFNRDDWSDDRWVVGIVLGVILLGGIAYYSANNPGIGPSASTPETTGQATRPTLPALPN